MQMTSCRKDTSGAEIKLTKQLLEDKIWYLDYTQRLESGVVQSTKSYVGQSTYFIDFLSDNSTTDSDGLVGTFHITKTSGMLQIHVTARTSGGNNVEYVYDLLSVGAKNLVLSVQEGTVQSKYYYSSK